MKLAYLEVVLGALLTGFSAYAQTGMRGSPAVAIMPTVATTPAIGNGGVGGHVAPVPSHGGSGVRVTLPAQRNMGEHPGGVNHPGVVGNRISGDRREFSSRGGFDDRRVCRGGFFEHGRGHEHGVVVFAFGVPYFYYPYGYYDSAPYYAPDYGPSPSTGYAPVPNTQTESYANQGADSYYQPGSQWGGELKQYHVTMDQFVAYLKSYILSASPVQQAAFRTGFVAQFGAEGQTIYDQAVQQAIQQNQAAS